MLKRVSNINPAKFRSIELEKQNYFKIQNKEMMRDVVTDFIIRSVSTSNQSLSRKYRPRKYKPLQVKIEIKGTNHLFEFSLPSILQNYVAFQKTTSNREEGLQSLIIDILDFIDKLEDASSTLAIEVQGTLSPDIVLKAMISNHIREKNRKMLLGEFEEVKQKMYTKYKKVSFLEFGDGKVNRYQRDFFIQKANSQANSELRSRSNLGVLDNEQFNSNRITVPTKSKLKTLVDNYNIFQHADKVEQLRIEKLKTQFCTNDKEIHQARQQIAKQFNTKASSNNDPAKILEDWISQISLSEYLFKKKYQTNKQNKHTPKRPSNTNSGFTSSDEQL